MNRRRFLRTAARRTAALTALGALGPALWLPGEAAAAPLEPEASTRGWLARWENSITRRGRTRYCDREMGEEIGWLISPFLDGFYYGYLATRNVKWVERWADWTEAWVRRAVTEPDGYLGWPKQGTGGLYSKDLHMDSLLGEAMVLRPVVLMADEILRSPTLKPVHGAKAESYLKLAERMFEKWNARHCWRETKDGGVWVVPPFGLDPKTNQWTAGYAQRQTDGFSHPANKQNLITRWVIALYDVTRKPIYRERAELWWRVMKARMRLRDAGRYFVWNYWDPAGPWDFKPDGSPKHWVGVHPNGGYYGGDVEGIVTAYEHGLVFKKDEIDRLIATNRDFMWNQQMTGAKFKRIDGGLADLREERAPGVLWTALIPHDVTLRQIFEANHDPESWSGLVTTPWYLSRFKGEGGEPANAGKA